MVSETVAPANAWRAVTIWYRTQPNAQMSVRLSTAAPRCCSGLMKAVVPSTTPFLVSSKSVVPGELAAWLSERTLAIPKSRTLTSPSGVILMFSGFRSR